jgi:hypothetical protein
MPDECDYIYVYLYYTIILVATPFFLQCPRENYLNKQFTINELLKCPYQKLILKIIIFFEDKFDMTVSVSPMALPAAEFVLGMPFKYSFFLVSYFFTIPARFRVSARLTLRCSLPSTPMKI